jgi:signal peptidase I
MAGEKLDKLKTNNIFKEWVWPLLVALSVALLIKWKLGDLYSIPTGSMEPTLHGRENGGDRVFCNKLAYYFRDKYQPRRYETMVFVCPWEGTHKGENYIKRCIGLPEESLIISNGDIYVMPNGALKPKIAPKPLDLQDSIWIPVYKSDFSKQNEEELRYYWNRTGNDGRWTFKDGKLVGNSLTASYLTYKPVVEEHHLRFIPDRHVKRQTVDFQCPECSSKLRKMVNTQQLTAFCPKCGTFLSEKDIIADTFEHPGLFASDENPPRSSDYNAVSDLRLVINVKPLAKAGKFCAEFA